MSHPPPITIRAREWNTYVTSVIPYSAQIHPIPRPMERHLNDIMRSTFQTTGWCPWLVPSAYGPIHGISGAPR
eukprot:1071253-Prorocentrum_lima.AAC.1